MTTKTSESGYSKGGFTERYSVVRIDGKPSPSESRYIVLDYSGGDPHAVKALHVYADSVEQENPEFAADIRRALADPSSAPAQHPNAK
ncbi:hypothetical protein [Blastopirellula marina]|uniref:Uncharacterized protein n=1 Tax=Blastopirellula marina DSM 3645 TaxID=314230 RepID=A3ZSB3_9BACT|nr:hypothetical protein [Blastopirellula marina]EAQ80573.1 hypothetical protein DSM3645_14545 [Blastopirellula marina DSM 3645]